MNQTRPQFWYCCLSCPLSIAWDFGSRTLSSLDRACLWWCPFFRYGFMAAIPFVLQRRDPFGGVSAWSWLLRFLPQWWYFLWISFTPVLPLGVMMAVLLLLLIVVVVLRLMAALGVDPASGQVLLWWPVESSRIFCLLSRPSSIRFCYYNRSFGSIIFSFFFEQKNTIDNMTPEFINFSANLNFYFGGGIQLVDIHYY